MNRMIRGFTLIELMIVVAILAIAIALGYPSYREQVMKARRAEGMGELLELADRDLVAQEGLSSSSMAASMALS